MIDLQELLYLISLYGLFLIPGLLILRYLRSNLKEWDQIVTVGIVLGISIVPLIGILLSTFSILNTNSLVVIWVALSFFLIYSMRELFGKQFKSSYANFRSSFQIRASKRAQLQFINFNLNSGKILKVSLLAIIPTIIAIFNWDTAVGFFTADMGWHVFWSRTIIANFMLPDYSVIEPFDFAARFTFGPHVFLSVTSLLTGLNLEEIPWVPLLFLGTLQVLMIFVLVTKITHSRIIAAAASSIYSTIFYAGGFIQRGNLSDMLGYLILTTIIWFMISMLENPSKKKWLIACIGLLASSLAAYYQYAFLVFFMLFALFEIYLLLLHRKTFKIFNKSIFYEKTGLCIILITFFAPLLLFVFHSTYFNAESLSIISKADWSDWIHPWEQYPESFGYLFLIFGLLGFVLILLRNRPPEVLILTWFGVMVLLAHGPLVGLNFEPIRFVWRMTEQLSHTVYEKKMIMLPI